MKKFIYLFICLIFFVNFAKATELQGGVSFDVNSARDYLQDGQEDEISVTGPFQFHANSTDRVVYSYNPQGEVIGITVQYVNNPQMAYIYGRDRTLIYVDKYDKPTTVYPHRGYRYNLQGKLILTSLTVSKDEMFRFSPDGNLIAHSVKGVIYDENGKIIGSGK